MKRPRPQSTPTEALRWTLARAEIEFGTDHRTLSKRLAAASVRAGDDGKFSTREIANAVYGDIEGERLRLTRAQADEKESVVAERKRQLIPTTTAVHVVEEIVVALRQTIQHAPELNPTAKSKLVQTLEIDIHHALLRALPSDRASSDGAADQAT